MWIGIISLFPEMFNILKNYGIIGKAYKKKLVKIKIWNPRDFAKNKHKKVDHKPYGGGSGMIMQIEPLYEAIKKASSETKGIKPKIIYLSPKGERLTQNNIQKICTYKKIILVCGRYKGIDERIIISKIDEEWSIGDYIVSGGEMPAMILIDSIVRLIPGVVNQPKSIKNDSFSYNLLDHPHYTSPQIFKNMKVPSILLSGNHGKIKTWKLKQSLGSTFLKRPDLFKKLKINKIQMKLLNEYLIEYLQKINKDFGIKKNDNR